MTTIRFSKLARLDLLDIGDYTVDRWGEDQAIRYIESLEKSIRLIAAKPEIGRRCNRLRKGYRRIEHEKHVIFYQRNRDGIVIARILHQRVLPENWMMDDEE